MAYVKKRQGQFAEAEPLIRESLEIRRTALGGKHPDVAGSLEELALNFLDQGDFESPLPVSVKQVVAKS